MTKLVSFVAFIAPKPEMALHSPSDIPQPTTNAETANFHIFHITSLVVLSFIIFGIVTPYHCIVTGPQSIFILTLLKRYSTESC